MRAKFINEIYLKDNKPYRGYIKIFNDEGEQVGSFRVEKVGDIPIDPKHTFTDEYLKQEGFKRGHIFPNSAFFSGGFMIRPGYKKKKYGFKAIQQYFIDNPELENIFLYAVPWQESIPFWHKIGGKTIISVDDPKFSIQYIQLKRDDILYGDYSKKINEDVERVLKPKSDKEVKQDFIDILMNLNSVNAAELFSVESNLELVQTLEEICNTMNSDMDKVEIISDKEEVVYDVIEKIFIKLDSKNKDKNVILHKNDYTYYINPIYKITFISSTEWTGTSFLLFDYLHFINLIKKWEKLPT